MTILFDEFVDLIMQWSYNEYWNTWEIWWKWMLCFLEIMKSAKKLGRKQANENDCEITPVTWKPNGDTYAICNH